MMNIGEAAKASGAKVASVQFLGAASVPETDEERVRRRAELRKRIIALNRAPGQMAATVSPQDRTDLELAVDAAKLAFMEPLWAEDWGDLADFREWFDKRGPAPAGISTSVEYFQQSRTRMWRALLFFAAILSSSAAARETRSREGAVDGRIKDGVLHFTWREGKDSGGGRMESSNGGDALSGAWGVGKEEQGTGKWTAVRRKAGK